MKKWVNPCIKVALLISLLSCSQLVQANTSAQKVMIHQKQVSKQQVQLELDLENLGNDIIAFEVGMIADDVKDVLSIDAKIEDGYTTYQLHQTSEGKEQLVCYVVAEDKEQPLKNTNSILSVATFNLETEGKLSFDEKDFWIKVIKKGYQIESYEDIEMNYTESDHSGSDNNDSSNNESDNSGSGNNNSSNNGSDNNDSGNNDSSDNGSDNSGSGNNNSSNNGSDNNDSGNNDSSNGGSDNNGSDNNDSSNGGSDNNDSSNNGSDNNESDNTGSDGTNNQKPSISFTDIKGHWASGAIMSMAQRGIINGYIDGTFRPNASITRSEFAVLLARAFKIEKVDYNHPFKDVLANKWYTDSIIALYQAGITRGRLDGTFGINDLITNEEICTMIARTVEVLKLQLVETNPVGMSFTDSMQISNYAKEAVEFLVKRGVIQGKPDGSFGPQNSAIRAQVAVILERILKVIK